MKATATVIRGSVRAHATATGSLIVDCYTLPSGIRSKAEPTEEGGLLRFLRVAPEEPQQLVWLVPQYGVDYTVTTSNGVEWVIR